MKDHDQKLRDLVNASGFAFQLRVEEAVRSLRGENGWKVEAREYPWSANGRGGYADLILGSGGLCLVLECKRPRGGEWVFFLPDPEQKSRSHAMVRWADYCPNQRPLAGWCDTQVYPACAESDVCVVRGQGEDDRPLLERMAAVLLDSVESIAADHLRLERKHPMTWLFIPVIVTTASLYLCRFEPDAVNIETGTLDTAQFEPVQFVRFRKCLTNSTEVSEPEELRDMVIEGERTVFVVNSGRLLDWLIQVQTSAGGESSPWVVARKRLQQAGQA